MNQFESLCLLFDITLKPYQLILKQHIVAFTKNIAVFFIDKTLGKIVATPPRASRNTLQTQLLRRKRLRETDLNRCNHGYEPCA